MEGIHDEDVKTLWGALDASVSKIPVPRVSQVASEHWSAVWSSNADQC